MVSRLYRDHLHDEKEFFRAVIRLTHILFHGIAYIKGILFPLDKLTQCHSQPIPDCGVMNVKQ